MPQYTRDEILRLKNPAAAKKSPAITDLTIPCLKPEFVLNTIFNQRRQAGSCKPPATQVNFKDPNNEDGPDSAPMLMVIGG